MIYTPRPMIDAILSLGASGQLTNPQVCTKIEFRGYEISVAMDASHGRGALARTDIRIYKGEEDVTKVLFPNDACLIDAEDLARVFAVLSTTVLSKNERLCYTCGQATPFPSEPGEWEYNEHVTYPEDVGPGWRRAQIRVPAPNDRDGDEGLRFHPYTKGKPSKEPHWWPNAAWRPFKS